MKHLVLPAVCGLLAFTVSCAPKPIERHAWVTSLKPAKADYYRKLHADPWPAVSATLKKSNIQNFSIFEREIAGKTYLFAYLEYTGRDFDADMKKMAACPHTQRWWKETDPCQMGLANRKEGEWWKAMEEVYHLD